jgi:hypothetical protein
MAKNLPTLDRDLRKLYDSLVNEVTLVSLKWQTAKDLFGHSQERVDLLNRTAVSFFQVCQSTFRDDTFIGLSRLTDPLQSAGKDNLSLDRLLESLDRQVHSQLATDLAELISKAKELCKPFREYRHKKLAHLDLDTVLNTQTDSLPTITIGETNRALKSVYDVLNRFGQHFFDTTTWFDKIIQQAGVDSLALYLERGERAFKEDRQRKLD